jgi:hypothetical protein
MSVVLGKSQQGLKKGTTLVIGDNVDSIFF